MVLQEMTKIVPLPSYVLVEPIEDNQKSAGGVYLPESAKDKPMKGKILALSPVVPFEAKDALLLDDQTTWTKEVRKVKVGSIVVYKKWVNETLNHEGKEYLLVKFNELLAVIE